MAVFKMHKECWTQMQYEQYEPERVTFIICVCGKFMKLTYRGVRKAEED